MRSPVRFALPLLAACSTPPAPVVAPAPVPSSAAVVITAWGSDRAEEASLLAGVEALAATTCPAAAGSTVSLVARTDANGRISAYGDDAAEPKLADCMWEPLLRRGFAPDAHLTVTAASAVSPAAVPDPTASATGAPVRCVRKQSPNCRPDATCPQFVWASIPCEGLFPAP